MKKKKRKESGQALVEFALVLPLFMLLVMGIIDFGWMFYNYISFENSARNAARIACVEYSDCIYDTTNNTPVLGKTFSPNSRDIAGDNTNLFTDQEMDIADAVKNTLPDSVSDAHITIVYSYDTKMSSSNKMSDYDVNDRCSGNVTVTVTGKMRVLTPVLGVFSDDMKMQLKSAATYKVERQYNEADD